MNQQPRSLDILGHIGQQPLHPLKLGNRLAELLAGSGIVHRRLQPRLRDADRQRVAHADKMTLLGQMVAGVAHQLNTPLAFCKNNVQLSIRALEDLRDAVQRRVKRIDSGDVPDELPAALRELAEARHMLGDTLMGMGQMNELVDNLRSFTRLDRARTESVDLNATLSSVVYIAKAVKMGVLVKARYRILTGDGGRLRAVDHYGPPIKRKAP